MASAIEKAQLRRLIQKAKNCYYNSGSFYKAKPYEVPKNLLPVLAKTKGVVTDEAYDVLEAELALICPNDKEFKKVGAPLTNKKARVNVPFPMPSLNKADPESLVNWLKKNPGPYLATEKVDGVSIGMFQTTPYKVFATTRGDGVIGGDISFMAKALSIPILPAGTKVRGEVVMEDAVFNKHFSGGFANARNLVSGLTNRNEVNPALKKCKVVAYELIHPRKGVPSQALRTLAGLGFCVPKHKVFPAGAKAEDFLAFFNKLKETTKYAIDGLVIITDRVHPLAKENPSYAVALKDFNANPAAKTTVLNVEWNPGRTGKLFPRINVKPISIGGVTVNYCSGKSADFVEQNCIGPGAVITVARSGDVIPDVRSIIKSASKPQLPSKKDFPTLRRDGANFVLDNTDHHPEITMKRIANFFSVVGIKNFKGATIEKFMAEGYSTLESILVLKEHQYLAIPDISKKVVAEVFAQLQEVGDGIPQHTAMLASGCFGGNVGPAMLAKLDKYRCVSTPGAELKAKLLTDPDLTDRERKLLVSGVGKFRKWLKLVNSVLKVDDAPMKAKKRVSGKLSGTNFVFSGIRDKEMEASLEAQGGVISSSVKDKDTILIVKDTNSTSSKTIKARELGCVILSYALAKEKYPVSSNSALSLF